MITEQDRTFLRRAMRLAMNGRGHVEPNPMVGCVLVKNGQIIGEGWHVAFGKDHAEPTALNDCKSRGNDPAGATAYVTLEPCCHTNKKTPPCAPRLIEAKVKRVVIGCLDPNPDVNGKGVEMLRKAGIEVDCLPGVKPAGPLAPVLGGEGQGEGVRPSDLQGTAEQRQALTPTLSQKERELDASHFQQLIAPFTKLQQTQLPYVTMKWAHSADAKVAGPGGVRRQISNQDSMRQVHELRSNCDAIVVGARTVEIDDPMLVSRVARPRRVADRIVIDRAFRLPINSQLVRTAHEFETVLVCRNDTEPSDEAVARLIAAGVEFWWPESSDDCLKAALTAGNRAERIRPYAHVLIEAGPVLARAYFDSGYVDRLWVFSSPSPIDEPSAPAAAPIPSHFLPVATLNLAGDILTEYLNTQSGAFFAPVPSADFVLAQEDVARAGEGFPFTPGT